MPDAQLDTMLRAVAAVAAEAGRLALAKAASGVERWEKPGGEPVCEADIAVDRLLRARLATIDPAAGWLSEESIDDPARLAADRVWVVDPIDGTRDYLRGRAGWAVSIALIEHGRPVLAVLEAAARGETWLARAGGGATRGGAAVAVAPRDAIAGARVPADQLPRRDRDFVAVAKPNSIALRIAMVAAGDADLVATTRWGHEWDVAAAVLIASEAGARVSDALGAPLRFNTPAAQAFGVLVTAPGIHAAAIERLSGMPQVVERTRPIVPAADPALEATSRPNRPPPEPSPPIGPARQPGPSKTPAATTPIGASRRYRVPRTCRCIRTMRPRRGARRPIIAIGCWRDRAGDGARRRAGAAVRAQGPAPSSSCRSPPRWWSPWRSCRCSSGWNGAASPPGWPHFCAWYSSSASQTCDRRDRRAGHQLGGTGAAAHRPDQDDGAAAP